MAITEKQQRFIEDIAKHVQKYARAYGILVHSPIIAQAILESGWGESKLASKYHNYFGMKCGTTWTGKSVNMETKEEYTPGTLTTIKDNFRVYDSMEEGVKGYFEFIQKPRYKNLKGVTDAKKYLQLIKADGYATASSYVESTYRLITQYELTEYDVEGGTNMKKIVLPIDGSARSQRTIAITKQIFHGQDAEITLLMVLPEPRYTDAQAERDRATIQANQELADFAKEFAGWKVKTVLLRGHPGPEIVQYARDHGYDTLVMTRSSRGPLQKLGSVATYIVRNAQFLDLIVMREDVV